MNDAELARTRWRCRRGLLELDLLLLRFVEQGYADLDPAQRTVFTRMLELADAELLGLLQGESTPNDPELTRLVAIIRCHTDVRA